MGYSILEGPRSMWFKEHLHKVDSLLDLGCRDGTLTRHLAEGIKTVVGVDVDTHALERAKQQVPHGRFFSLDLLGDWQELEGATFDAIVCSEVLEHVYFPHEVCEKIKQHLKPGGVFLGSVPNAFFLKHRLRYLLGRRRFTPLEDPTHITQFNFDELKKMLTVIGSNITISGYTRPPFVGLAKRCPSMFAFDFLFEVRL